MTRIAMTLLLVATLAACNTVRGAGQDIETAGDAVKRTTDDITR